MDLIYLLIVIFACLTACENALDINTANSPQMIVARLLDVSDSIDNIKDPALFEANPGYSISVCRGSWSLQQHINCK